MLGRGTGSCTLAPGQSPPTERLSSAVSLMLWSAVRAVPCLGTVVCVCVSVCVCVCFVVGIAVVYIELPHHAAGSCRDSDIPRSHVVGFGSVCLRSHQEITGFPGLEAPSPSPWPCPWSRGPALAFPRCAFYARRTWYSAHVASLLKELRDLQVVLGS